MAEQHCYKETGVGRYKLSLSKWGYLEKHEIKFDSNIEPQTIASTIS